jgi:hypothetical protein
LAAAWVFLHLRWLGDCPAEDGASEEAVDFDELRRLGEEFSRLDE